MLAGVLASLLLIGQAVAINIDLTYDEGDTPSFDPNGTKLMAVARAAADMWESIILDDSDWHFDISWDHLSGNRLGQYTPSYFLGDSIDITLSTHNQGALAPWFFDETPLENEEYLPFTQTLVRDLTPEDADEAYSGGPPLLLEAGFSAQSRSGSAATGNFDALSILLHEMGHALGMNYSFNDEDYDIDPNDIGGLSVGLEEGEGYELKLQTALMNDFVGVKGKRTLPSASDILATHDQGDFTNYNLPRVEFLGGQSTDWNYYGNWIGGAVPDGDNAVFVRNGGSVIGSGISTFAKSLVVDDGSSLLTLGNNRLIVSEQVRIGDAGKATRGEIHIGQLNGVPKFEMGSLNINNGLLNLVSQGSSLWVKGDAFVNADSTLMGAGYMEIEGTLQNEGEISAGTLVLFTFGGDLFVRAIGNGKLNLDGGPAENPPPVYPNPPAPPVEDGQISAVNGNLWIVGPLSDWFNGNASIGAGRSMNFNAPWQMYGALNMKGGTTNDKAATLAGADVTLGGKTTIEGIATIAAPLTTGYYTDITVKSGGRLNLTTSKLGPSPNTGEFGGKVTLEENATLNVDLPGTSWANAGVLVMSPGSKVMGDVIGNWNGRIEGSGTLAVSQVINGGVVAPGPELINFGHFYQQYNGRLEIDLGGFEAGQTYDWLASYSAHVEGALQISLAEGFVPAAGSTFDFLTGPQVTGAFDTMNIVAPEGVTFEGKLIYESYRVRFQVTRAMFDADLDADGDVDGEDLLAWQNSSEPDGDFFLLWQRQLGSKLDVPLSSFDGLYMPQSPIGPVGVPEPSSATLTLGSAAVAAAIACRRRGRANADDVGARGIAGVAFPISPVRADRGVNGI